jgi:type IV secretory pathway ATPase VirB11/archaellum biosynthesis ATPase
MLRTALGPRIAGWLDDDSVVEVMPNPDGRLWLDRLKSGLEDAGATLPPEDGKRIVRLVAHHVGAEVHAGAPRVSAKLPETGERFEGLLPPVVTPRPSPSASPPSPCSRSTIPSRAASSRRSISRAYLLLTQGLPEGLVSKNGPEGPSLSF